MSKTNLIPEMFPDPAKRGVIMEPVCGELEIHIWRLLLDHLASGEALPLLDKSAVGFQDKTPRTNKTFLLHNSEFKNQQVAVTGETPGVITYDFPDDSPTHIMRGIIGGTNRITRTRMLESLQKRHIPVEKQAIIIPEIEKTDELWFTSVFLTMLTQVGVGLSVQEREQLIANIEWFHQNYR
ncbi:MAG: aminotransferase class IV [Candidatus Pacebacteria bacterium]|nr:aminotransferase class IV [Candidatus Paceibacterota bacterium]